mmetsp:Transcript_61329/g.70475  ORF Transcript_61329/g.70475 Transcript_61329/m.70475 type:complete len:274 (+) Transcript_61329:105-926(+)
MQLSCVILMSSVVLVLCREYNKYDGPKSKFWSPATERRRFNRIFHKVILRGGEKGDISSGNDDFDDNSNNDSNRAPISEDSIRNDFEIIDEKTVYSGWRTIIQRKVRMRNNKVVNFDLVGVKTGDSAVLIFAWDTKSKTATLIREYMPASNQILWGLAAGLVEKKHNNHNMEVAARHELEEECHLKNGRWITLLNQPTAMDKYATTTIQCYLVLDPEQEDNPRSLDEEEDIEIISGVTIPEILQWIRNGEMNLVGGFGCLLAIEKLRELGEYQ